MRVIDAKWPASIGDPELCHIRQHEPPFAASNEFAPCCCESEFHRPGTVMSFLSLRLRACGIVVLSELRNKKRSPSGRNPRPDSLRRSLKRSPVSEGNAEPSAKGVKSGALATLLHTSS
jgi:hypothetical protein